MASYKLIGQRNLRKYSAEKTSPTYAAAIDAQLIVDSLCDVPWTKVSDKSATMTYHTEENVGTKDKPVSGLDMNVVIRDQFDAALFCAGHSGGQHRAHANAAVYHYVLPDGTLPRLTRLVANVTSDPYNSAGARIAILTNATGEIPTNCNTCRTGDAHADGVAPRTVAENGNWFPTMSDCVFSATPGEGETALPSGGLQLQKHLFLFVLMESYSTVRGNWLEGCSFIRNLIDITTDSAIPGWTDGDTLDLTASCVETKIRSLNLLDGTATERVIQGDVGSISPSIKSNTHCALITGSFGDLGYAGLRGVAKIGIDLENISVPQQTDPSKRMTQDAADIFSTLGACIVYVYYSSYSAIVPFKARASGLTGLYIIDSQSAYQEGGPIDYEKTAVKCNFSIPLPGCRGYEFYDDRIVIIGNDDIPVKVDFSGKISSVQAGFLGFQSLIVSGQNTIAGNASPVKLLFADGTVLDFGIDLTPDDWKNFRAKYIYGDIDNLDLQSFNFKELTPEQIGARKSICIKTEDAFGSYDITTSSSGSAHNIAWQIPMGVDRALLCITGNFSKIGGISANGAVVVCCSYIRSDQNVHHYRLNIVPFDVGKVKEGTFVPSETNDLNRDVGVSHLIYIPEE